MSQLSETKKIALFTLSLFGMMLLTALGASAIPWSIEIWKIVFYIMSGIFAISFLICLVVTIICMYIKVTGRDVSETMREIRDWISDL